ncbi:hypothetical protein EJB05_12503 [Eragrostis curvula]|uniref:Uncharacterized protein n=1 Tax=Eragrostis curvula TaxID=38414 RepID=A0A5J9VSF9_9POAL|nr:hypothetical protein EJB05_12503 [Eragrostis curvula]
MLGFVFGKRKTLAELLRETKRTLEKSIREIERERQGLQAQEKKLIAEIKKVAKLGQMNVHLSYSEHWLCIITILCFDDALAVVDRRCENSGKGPCPHKTTDHKILCAEVPATSCSLSCSGNYEILHTVFVLSHFELHMSENCTTMKSTQTMGEAMKDVTKAMSQMSSQMNLPALQKIMRDFEMQTEKMEMVSEVMGDAIDDALEGDEEEEETEELVNQVLDEIGIDINSQLVKAPATTVAKPTAGGKVSAQPEASDGVDGGINDELQARLDNLRKM